MELNDVVYGYLFIPLLVLMKITRWFCLKLR